MKMIKKITSVFMTFLVMAALVIGSTSMVFAADKIDESVKTSLVTTAEGLTDAIVALKDADIENYMNTGDDFTTSAMQSWQTSKDELGAKKESNGETTVTLKDDTVLEDFEKLKSVIKDFGANTVMTTPQEHDKAVALISHAPMLVAQALCKNIESNELAQKLASSGFRDTTRLALSNTEMANDMILMNGENIKDVVTLLDKNIDAILESDYKKEAEHIKDFRQNLYATKTI